MDVVDIMSSEDVLAVSRDLDAILGREGARDNPNPYDNGMGRGHTSIPYANWVQTCPFHLLGVQIVNYGRSDHGLPDLPEGVQAHRTNLFGKKICFRGIRACWLNPDVRVRTSYQTGSRRYAVIVVLGLDGRR